MTGAGGGQTERDRLFVLHQGLVRAIAWKTHRRVPQQVEIDDLVAYGQIGLLEAINAFDAGLGRKFVTFAWHRIRGSMLDGLGKMAWFDRARFERGQYEPKPTAGDATPSGAGSSSGAGTAGDATPLPAVARPRPARSDLDPATVAARDRDTLEAVMVSEEIAFLRLLIDALPEKEAGLLRGTFFEGRTLTEAARRVGISTAWASRLQSRTLGDLRVALERAGFGGPA